MSDINHKLSQKIGQKVKSSYIFRTKKEKAEKLSDNDETRSI